MEGQSAELITVERKLLSLEPVSNYTYVFTWKCEIIFAGLKSSGPQHFLQVAKDVRLVIVALVFFMFCQLVYQAMIWSGTLVGCVSGRVSLLFWLIVCRALK